MLRNEDGVNGKIGEICTERNRLVDFFPVSPRQTEQHLVLGLSFQWKTNIDEKFNRNLLPKKSFTVCRIVSVNFCVIYINELHLFKRDNALPFDFAGVVASFLNSYEQCFQTNQYFIN